MKLTDMTAFEVDRLSRHTLVLVPIAALEQHSRHLPVFTDSIIAGAVAQGVEAKLPNDVLLLPVQWLGASDHHLGFAGTVSLSVDTHADVLQQILLSLLRNGFENILVLNGHGGNVDPMHVALRRLANTHPQARLAAACYWDIAAKTIAAALRGPRKEVGHACEMETALVMAIRPDLVREKEIRDDPPRSQPAGVFIPLDMKTQTRQGQQGFATHADPAVGRKLLEAIIKEVAATVADLRKSAQKTRKVRQDAKTPRRGAGGRK